MTNHTREEVTQEELDQLVEDASYLQDEAEALQYVIDEVPYTEIPPGGASIAEMLLLIDHAQLTYFRPIIEDVYEQSRPVHLKNYEDYTETFELDEGKVKDIQKVLSKIVKHRAGIVNFIKSIPLIDWETVLYRNNKELILFDFAQDMIRFDRRKLKEIADLVMVFNQEQEARREIDKRAERQSTGNQSSSQQET